MKSNHEFAACVHVAFVSFHLKVMPLDLGSVRESTGEFVKKFIAEYSTCHLCQYIGLGPNCCSLSGVPCAVWVLGTKL